MLGFEETEPLLPFDAAAGEADNDLAWVAVDSSKPVSETSCFMPLRRDGLVWQEACRICS